MAKRNRITFVDAQGQREIYLSSNYDVAVVKEFKGMVKRLSDIQRFGGELTKQETTRLENLLPDLRKKLIEHKLIEGKRDERILSIQQLISQYRASRKHLSQDRDERFERYMYECFGTDKRIDTFKKTDAAMFESYMQYERPERKIEKASAAFFIETLKRVFAFAVDGELLPKSPFAGVKVGSKINNGKFYRVSLQELRDAVEVCRHPELKFILLLWGLLGLRPKDCRDLMYSSFDVKPDGFGFIDVPNSGKTGTRRVPYLPMLTPYLDAVRLSAAEGQEYVFAKYRTSANIQEMVKKEMRQAGLKVWEKFFNNLRSSSCTFLKNLGMSESVRSAVFGNNAATRHDHYDQPGTDEEYLEWGRKLDAVYSDGMYGTEQAAESSPLNSPYKGGFSGYYSFIADLVERRATYSDIVNILLEERNIDKDLYKEFAKSNPVICKIANFINSLLSRAYDENSGTVTWRSIFWDLVRIGYRVPMLWKEFYRNLTAPPVFATAPIRSGRT